MARTQIHAPDTLLGDMQAGLSPLRLQAKSLVAAFAFLLFVPLAILDPSVATAVAAGLALFGAAVTLSHADATAKRNRTAEYQARWQHPELLDARIAAADFLEDASRGEDERWEEWSVDMKAKTRLQLMAVLNFWEEVSVAYNQGLLDNDWFGRGFAWDLLYNWERAEWFVRKYRTEDKNALGYREWQLALEAVKPELELQSKVGQMRAEQALAQKEDILYIDQPGFLEGKLRSSGQFR